MLHFAAKGGNTNLIRKLVENESVQIDAKNKDGITPLRVAHMFNHTEAVRELLEAGA